MSGPKWAWMRGAQGLELLRLEAGAQRQLDAQHLLGRQAPALDVVLADLHRVGIGGVDDQADVGGAQAAVAAGTGSQRGAAHCADAAAAPLRRRASRPQRLPAAGADAAAGSACACAGPPDASVARSGQQAQRPHAMPACNLSSAMQKRSNERHNILHEGQGAPEADDPGARTQFRAVRRAGLAPGSGVAEADQRPDRAAPVDRAPHPERPGDRRLRRPAAGRQLPPGHAPARTGQPGQGAARRARGRARARCANCTS